MSDTDRGAPSGRQPPDAPLGIRPRTRWLLAATLLIGLVGGLGAFTFGVAKGHSYLRDDPAACANCHVMQEYYAAWERGSHRAVATCNSCHTPHNIVGKYYTKASNGFWHSFYFTTGRFPDPIRITPGNARITENACRGCHEQLTATITPAARPNTGGDMKDVHPTLAGHGAEDTSASCVRCHATVGHWVRE
jgi:cytochrome c nitrite reductase small subunit